MTINTDVLIIGGGGAACRAAIEAANCGVSVLLASKKPPVKAGTTSFPVAEMAGYNAGDPAVPGDTERHYRDIVDAGQGMAIEELAAILAANAPSTITRLEEWGLRYERAGNDYYVFRSCFSQHPRTHVIRGHGEPIVRTMLTQIEKRRNIKIIDSITITGLFIHDGRCCGAFGWTAEGEKTVINAGAVVMATGGASQAFERNLNPPDVCGDGYAMGFSAGANLINMEFMQIGVGFCHPVVNIFNAYIWEGKPSLFNALGQEFLSANLPAGLTADAVMHEHRRHFPFSSSDVGKYLEISILKEIREGRGGEHGGITADLRMMTDDYVNSLPDDCGIHHMWPIARDYLKTKGVDLLKQTVEICCFAHAINGGLLIDKNAATSIPGLFAAGETAGGPHGADRLGGNMMVTCQVFGAIAGKSAAEYNLRNQHYKTQNPSASEIEVMSGLLHKKVDTKAMFALLCKTTQQNLLVGRTEEGLKKVLDVAKSLENEFETAPAGNEIFLRNFEITSMLTSVKLMAYAALQRKESRGSHHREDYPDKDEAKAKPFVINKISTQL